MLGALIGWAIVGVIATGVIGKFWENIKNWLNNNAANAVEKYLGYNARQFMFRATSTIDKVVNKIKNRTIVYTKKNRLDNYYSKVTLEAEAEPYQIDQEVLRKIEAERQLVNDFEFRGN